MKWLRLLAVAPIRFYRRFISPLKPRTCRFQPTCSKYGERAVLQHGIAKGAVLTVWRVLRCQPFSEGGFDPVPRKGRWRPDPTSGRADERAERKEELGA